MNSTTIFRIVAVAALSLVVLGCDAGESDPDGLEAHFGVSEEAAAADTGLPAYLGSEPYREDEDSSSAANIGISTSLFGFNIVALKLETADSPEQVALFYRKALSKYGDVLECKDGMEGKKGFHGGDLECDADGAEEQVVYKVGTEQHQRIVAIKPHGRGTRFNIVHLDIRGNQEVFSQRVKEGEK